MKQGFRSGLEKELSEKLDGQYKFEPYGLPYTTHREVPTGLRTRRQGSTDRVQGLLQSR